MAPHSHDEFNTARNRSLDLILAMVSDRINKLAPPLITDLHTLSPDAMTMSAEREAWQLLLSGIKHLKDGAPSGGPGSISSALSKASLRSCALAATLGIKPPEFENIILPANYSTGHEAAVYQTSWLINAAENDLEKSRSVIEQKIARENIHQAFGAYDSTDPQIKHLQDSVKKDNTANANKDPLGSIPRMDILDFRRQMVMSYNMTSSAYPACCEALLIDINKMPPPAAIPPRKPQGGTFNL